MRPGIVVSHLKKTQKSFIFVIHIDLRVTNDPEISMQYFFFSLNPFKLKIVLILRNGTDVE